MLKTCDGLELLPFRVAALECCGIQGLGILSLVVAEKSGKLLDADFATEIACKNRRESSLAIAGQV